MDLRGELLRLAGRQYGVVGRAQALELGVASSTFARWTRGEGWVPLHPGVWALPGTDVTNPRTRMSGGALAAGPQARVTGQAGLWLHGAADQPPDLVRLVVPMADHTARHTLTGIRMIASRTLLDSDRVLAQRIPAATPERCFLDLALPPAPTVDRVRDLLITATQLRSTDPERVLRRVRAADGFPGAHLVERAVRDALSSGADSPFAHRVHRRLRADGFRPDRAPAIVATADRILHPDITFAPRRVCLECDGLRAHSRQRDLAVDHRKDRAYRSAAWVCLRIGWWEYTHGWPGFVAALRDALDGRTSP
jgi:hypothetical protein